MNESFKKSGGLFGVSVKKLIFFSVIILFFFLKASFVFALEVNYPTILGIGIGNGTLPEYAKYFFNLGMGLAGFIAVISVAVGGIYYLIDYGKGKFTSEGKDRIKSGILGLLIVFCSYLIANTINPNLVIFKLNTLSSVLLGTSNTPATPLPPGVGVTIYDEVPLGILTENVLTRTMDCYAFDAQGNPIDRDQKPTTQYDYYKPTYQNDDRVDCLAQLFDGAQKKAQVTNELSKAIRDLMSGCVCNGSKCQPACGNDCGTPDNGCQGACSNCKSACTGGDCCNAGVKDRIETGKNGGINIGIGTVTANYAYPAGSDFSEPVNNTTYPVYKITYKGLDEFRCPNPISGGHLSCDDVQSFVEKPITTTVGGATKTFIAINKNNWNKLNLVQQLRYFKEKIASIRLLIQQDVKAMDDAKAKLATKNCYMATSYVDLVKNYESTDKNKTVVLTKKVFTDPQTGSLINVAKYCKGFNYNNSSCLKKCNDACPDTSQAAMASYSNCKGYECDIYDINCLDGQEECIKEAYGLRLCQNKDSSEKFKNFDECVTSCQTDCSTTCSAKYLPKSLELTVCKNQCKDNSKCILDNAGDCLFGAQGFIDCAVQNNALSGSDQGSTSYCINNAYLCKSGSDEYAGYSACSTLPSSSACPTDQYSSSFFYKNPTCQKCPQPYNIAAKTSACYSKTSPNSSCQEICPETTKCPTASSCPYCSCDEIDKKTFSFSAPNVTNAGPGTCKKPDIIEPGQSTLNEKVSAYRITSPQCTDYAFNDDPLTFYCQENWWDDQKIQKNLNQKTPIGEKKVCPISGEIPIGETVDAVDDWFSKLSNIIKAEEDAIMGKGIDKSMVDFLKTNLGDAAKTNIPAPNYCKCNATFKDATPVCSTDCQKITSGDPPVDSCVVVPCSGLSCSQMMNYLSKVSDYYRRLKVDGFMNFYISGISDSWGRSDIMKKLTYSRQKTSECSVVNTNYNSSAVLMDCTRVENEVANGQIQSTNTSLSKALGYYCYGVNLGNLSNNKLTDNWFCCQNWSQEATNSSGSGSSDNLGEFDTGEGEFGGGY